MNDVYHRKHLEVNSQDISMLFFFIKSSEDHNHFLIEVLAKILGKNMNRL